MRVNFLAVLFFVFNHLHAQDTSKKNKVIQRDSVIQIVNIVPKIDTIITKSVNEANSGFDTKTNMPWIVAFLVGVVTIGANISINKSQRKLNEKLIEKQLSNNLKTQEFQFVSNISSKNRQDWINALRENVSEFISKAIFLQLKIAESGDFKNLNSNDEFKQLNALRWKTILLLNSANEDDHKKLEELIDSMFELDKITEKYLENLDLIKYQTQKIIKYEWEKIKNLKLSNENK